MKSGCFPATLVPLTKLFGIQLDVSSNKTATLIRRAPSLSEITACSGQKIRRITELERQKSWQRLNTRVLR